ncbi:MAG: glycoside hydrolase family 3 protein [Hyphomonadaceae bacterium]|nr:glycoside hydrolase family 3 protein [Hyphomonadaceae bacterium]
MRELLKGLSLDEKALLTAGKSMWASAELPRIGLRSIRMSDGPMGIASGRVDERDIAILSPCGMALGASWDRDLVARIGAIVGHDAIAHGVDMVLAPNLNLPRSPLAGRTFELFSEDPFLTGALGAAWISGLQSRGVASAAKHLVANDSETQRNTMNSVVDERALREVYLLPFEMAADAGAVGMLAAYNRVNGVYCAEHEAIIAIVKRDWDFKGPIMSDWFGTQDGPASMRGGLDLEMPGPARHMGPAFAAAVGEGRVSEARLDDAAGRMLHAAAWLGKLGEAPRKPAAQLSQQDIDATLLEAAAAGFVLLRNRDALLPVAPGAVRSIAVIGPNAAAPCYQGGTFAKISAHPDTPTPWDSLQRLYADACEIAFESGVDPQPRLPSMPATPARDIGDGAVKGMTIDYFEGRDLDAAPFFTETRNTNSLTWFSGVHELDTMKAGGVRASGVFTPHQSGDHTFYIGATGSVRLLIDSREVFNRASDLKAADVMGALKSGDADSIVLSLKAGVPVAIVAELRFEPARVHGLWYGVRPPDNPDAMLQRAVALAKRSDVVFLVVGETSDAGVESKDRTTTQIAPEQIALIEAVCDANPRTAIIANIAHAFDATWSARAAAFLCTWYPGQGFGPALAQVLSGEREPGGRLPVTLAAQDADYPAFDLTPDANGDLPYRESWLIGYRSFARKGVKPLYALGAGRGYAAFKWGDAHIDGEPRSGMSITVRVRNVSHRRGKEVVQAYVTLTGAEHGAPMLKGFTALHLEPGETREAELYLPPRAFQYWSLDKRAWVTPKGSIEIVVGRAVDDIVSAIRAE